MQNVQGIQESALLVFGGLITEVNAFDVPAGSSPICTDCDFTVASVKTRDGLASVYAYQGASETLNAGAGLTTGTGTAWTNPNNLAISGQSTTVAVPVDSSSALLEGTNFGFTVPLTSQIIGMEVTVHGTAFETGAASISGDFTIFPSVVVNWSAVILAFDTVSGQTPNIIFRPDLGRTAFENSNTNTFAFSPINITNAGDLLIVHAAFQTNSSITPGISDVPVSGLPNTWAIAANVFDAVSHTQIVIWKTLANLATTTTIAVTSSANCLTAGAAYWEIQHMVGTVSAPVHATGTSDSPSAGSLITTTPNSFALAVAATAPTAINTMFGGSGWTLPVVALNIQNGGNNLYIGTEYQTVSGGGVPATGSLTIAPDQFPGNTKPFTLGLSNTDVTLGGMFDLWGGTWTPAMVNDPGFGFAIQGIATALSSTFDINNPMTVTVWYTPPGVTQFDYVKTFAMTDGETLTLALDNTGVFWQEDVTNNPGVLTPFYTAIEPNTFARSTTLDDHEFIALSDLSQGTDMPRQYNGQWVDRLSQVGPAAPPSVSSTSTTFSVVSITQPGTVNIGGSTPNGGGVQWNAGVNSNSPGNTLIPYTATSTFTDGVLVGSVVHLALTGPGLSGGDGTYIVTSVGAALGMESGDGVNFEYFTVTAPSTAKLNVFNNSVPVGTYQLTVATLTVSAPVPGLTVGSQITLTGVTPGTWNGTWTITNVLNGASLEITSTSLTGDVATYNYTLVSGIAPTVGQFVTITGCVNGPVVNGQSIFNQFEAQISSVGPGFFTIFPVNAADVPLAPETSAVALVLGTEFQFDPGLNDVGTANNPILGTGTGGSLVVAGGLGAGLRQAVVIFETRNGDLTQPSPPFSFNLTENANSITVTNLPIGPPNVIRRIVAFTGANGGFYFYIASPVTVISSGQSVTYTSTVVNDNTSTQATFNFTDAILLSSVSIDSQGNNLFAQEELGSSLGIIAYSQRLFAWGEQNKVGNFNNMTFDGGYLSVTPTTPLQPLGWTIDTVNGAGGSLVVSPLFGDAYQISNTSGMTQAAYGMIEQTAYQDPNNVPIINVQTEYSVRVTASCPTPTPSGNLIIDLFSPSFATSFGTFSTPLASLGTGMQIVTGTLLTTVFQTSVPQDLIVRVWAQNIPDNGLVLIDRIEPFPTMQPVLTTQLRASYFDNFAAFDTITGNLGVASQNQQPVKNAFELFDDLYIVKTASFYSTTDNGTTEPSGWTVREVSNKVGTPSIYGVDVGEGWALIVGQAGLYLYSGGEPIKINPELDGNPGLWDSIRWEFGNTVWIRNDTNKRKIYIGVPLPTPNQWMPHFPNNPNPTKPNVVLACIYKELMTSGALASEGPVRLTYTGELKTFALGRKWAAWSIEACYADFITRPDTTTPIFFCADDGNPKIYQQITGQYNDDGEALICEYFTYPFLKSQEAQQMQIGLTEVEAKYMTLLVQGSGELKMTIHPDSINSQDSEALYPEPLFDPPKHDTEIPLNQLGNRFFMEFSVEGPNEWFELSRVVMAMALSAWSPVRGSNQ